MKIVAVSGLDQATSSRLALVSLASWVAILGVTGFIFWATLRDPKKGRR